VQDLLGQPRVVSEARRRECDAVRPVGARQSAAFERVPDILDVEAARIFGRDDESTQMEMLSMRLGKPLDGHLAGARAFAHRGWVARKRLQHGQRAQLEGIELQRILSERHGKRESPQMIDAGRLA